MIGVVDYGCGNPGSVLSMLRRIQVPARRVREEAEFEGCDRFVLPGVGAFDDVVTRFRASGLDGQLERRVRDQRAPLLGICVGMQMLADASEEGTEPGFGWVPGQVRHLSHIVPQETRLPVMGWQYIEQRSGAVLPTEADTRFYFVHSYYFEVEFDADLALVASAPGFPPAAVRRGNIVGTQFHPEKSHRFGMALLSWFAQWEPDA